ncbi:MAG: orotate phosphoribosyltransferase, partial [Candidatus Hydrogenedentes bacterium]|nr:orotate phosphoribosyltransferase [Candidatus Hydrogenedentota bacterium]
MNADEVIAIFKQCGALLDGHFIYTSGRHGRQFLQAARVLQYPEFTSRLCNALAGRFRSDGVELVVGPATGGIVLAYETARALEARAAYTEKDGDGGMALKRGFTLKAGARVLVVEDIITTGGSVRKSVEHLRARGADVVGVGVLLDRSRGEAAFDCRFEPLATLDMESWPPDTCALC